MFAPREKRRGRAVGAEKLVDVNITRNVINPENKNENVQRSMR